MKKRLIFLSFIILINNFSFIKAQYNPIIDSLARDIDADSIARTVRDLEAFGDRFAIRNNKNVAEYLVQRLQNYGVANAYIDSFYVTGYSWLTGSFANYMYNVKGSLIGSEQPDSIVIIGAHLDAISYNQNYQLYLETPGADDNASGVAMMIEMARIIQHHQLSPELTIDFMAYDGEELGLIGSGFDARSRRDSNENVVVMLNNDMVGYQPDTLLWEVMLFWYDNSMDIVQKMATYCQNYTSIQPIVPNIEDNDLAAYSDSQSYYDKDFNTVFSCEKWFSPYYHSLNDSSGFCNYNYMADVARMNFAALFEFSRLQLFVDTTEEPIDTVIPSHIETIPALAGAYIYPNPSYRQATLQLIVNEATALQIEIFDMTGRLVLAYPETRYMPDIYQVNLACNSFTSGLYFCKIKEKSKITNIKWMVASQR